MVASCTKESHQLLICVSKAVFVPNKDAVQPIDASTLSSGHLPTLSMKTSTIFADKVVLDLVELEEVVVIDARCLRHRPREDH